MYPISRYSQRLALRELTAADVDAVFGIYGDPGITKYLSFEPRAREQVRQIIDRSIASAGASPRNEYALAITERKDNGLIGVGRIAVDPHQPRGATFGFALHSSVWGAGYGVEAVRLLLGLGFGDLRLHRIWGARAPLNEASARTMTKAGMVEEGVIRQHIEKAGQWRDSVVHSMLESEWASA